MYTLDLKLPVKKHLLFLLLALIVGSVFRIAPILEDTDRVLQQWPTEDGYLMLTIARNMALDKGMSVANGEIATNGTQPLATWLYSHAFKMVDGDKAEGVFWVLIIQWLISLIGAVLFYRVLKSVLFPWAHAPISAALGAGLWFVSTVFISHAMNCLESGLWMVAVIAVFGTWHKSLLQQSANIDHVRWRQALLVGVVLGVATWVRIDAVFVIAAITIAHVAQQFITGKWHWPAVKVVFAEAFIMGFIAVIVVSPWLINNKLNFGAFVPISGTAQSATVGFGYNAALIPIKLFEYAYVLFGIPEVIENYFFTQCVALIGVLLWFMGVPRLLHNADKIQKTLLLAAFLMSLAYISYYGLFFGAPHFLARYFLPIGITMVCISSVYAVALSLRYLNMPDYWGKQVFAMTVLSLLLAVVGQNVRVYMKALPHQHWQVIKWVETNVPESAWVGAVQTGTLGFFHDRTLNLDGKVNPGALKAKLENRIPQYIVDSEIMFLVDWIGLANWIKLSPVTENFQLIVNDKDQNLAVLARVNRM